jgi:hypothetical protein
MTTAISTVFLPLASSRSYPMYWDVRSVMTQLGVIAVAGFLLWLTINRVGWLFMARQRFGQTHQALFGELCQAYALKRADRTLLTQISRALPPNQCCRVFIEVQIIRQFAQTNPADAEDCFELVRRLFGVQTR